LIVKIICDFDNSLVSRLSRKLYLIHMDFSEVKQREMSGKSKDKSSAEGKDPVKVCTLVFICPFGVPCCGYLRIREGFELHPDAKFWYRMQVRKVILHPDWEEIRPIA
jgi:hypothetical protein